MQNSITNVEGVSVSKPIGNILLSDAYLMSGRYSYCKGGSTETIEKDTVIDELIDLGNYVAVKIKGFDYGSFAVFDRKRILQKQRTRNIVWRKKPCHSINSNWKDAEWMAGVPIYCKIVDDGGACPLIREDGSLFSCDYEKSKVKDYIKVCKLNDIEVERITRVL